MPHQLFFCIQKTLALFSGAANSSLSSVATTCKQILEEICDLFLLALERLFF